MDVVDESCPDIFGQMREKGDFQPPTPLEIPPMVTRVGPTSLQVDQIRKCVAVFATVPLSPCVV